MKAKIQKWGNSLGVRLSKEIASKLHLVNGSQVIIEFDQKHIQITPVQYQLADFMDKINSNNLHEPSLQDDPRGREEW